LGNNFLYNGKELQTDLDLDWYDYGARMYDAAVGRFFTQDRFSEKYYGLSPYQYTANNPVLYIDVNGDSINLAGLMVGDLKAAISILWDLSEQTGLNLSVKSNGSLTYSKDKNTGEALVAEVDGEKAGSESARNFLTGLIDDTKSTITVGASTGQGSKTQGDHIWIDSEQIDGHINNTPNGLNDKTLGYGMTFLHELHHTTPGGSLSNPPRSDVSSTGKTVDKVNKYREEIDNNSYNDSSSQGYYGKRMFYNYYPGSNPYVSFRLPHKIPNIPRIVRVVKPK
jgi:RHS repeat-associated protein